MLSEYIYNKPIIAGEVIVLRPMTAEDTDDLREWISDKSLYQYWGKGPGKADLHPELMFAKEEKPSKSFHLGIEHKADRKIVGDLWIYLIENDRMAKIAFRVSPHYQKMGIATDAVRSAVRFCFSQTELKRVWSDVDVRNTASCRVMEKCGFQREGLIRQGKMVSSWCDYYIYGILRDDIE